MSFLGCAAIRFLSTNYRFIVAISGRDTCVLAIRAAMSNLFCNCARSFHLNCTINILMICDSDAKMVLMRWESGLAIR